MHGDQSKIKMIEKRDEKLPPWEMKQEKLINVKDEELCHPTLIWFPVDL